MDCAIEVYELPVKLADGSIPVGRYLQEPHCRVVIAQ